MREFIEELIFSKWDNTQSGPRIMMKQKKDRIEVRRAIQFWQNQEGRKVCEAFGNGDLVRGSGWKWRGNSKL